MSVFVVKSLRSYNCSVVTFTSCERFVSLILVKVYSYKFHIEQFNFP